jgi:two-component system chemotaxis sensor kinase CheA
LDDDRQIFMPTCENVVVVEHEGIRAGLMVDALHGETQAVVRPLGSGLGAVDGVTGGLS